MKALSTQILAKRVCYCCGSSTSRIQYRSNCKPHAIWILNHDHGDNMLCADCYHTYFYGPEYDRKNRNGKRIAFKGKAIYIKWLKRTGMCSKCQKMPKMTVMDHEYYIRILPWFSITEYCQSCHMKIGIERGQVNPAMAAYIRDVKRGLYQS